MKQHLCLDRNAGNDSACSERRLTSLALLLVVLVALSGCSAVHQANADLKSEHSHSESATMASMEPEAQDWAKQRLAKSPRHQEWVKVKYKPAGGGAEREVNAFVVYPEVKNKATAVLVIHEIFGMSDWVQSLTDQLAEAGYIAIAPDLLSGKGPNGGGTSDVASAGANAVGTAIRDLPPEQITADLNAVADYVSKLPGANGKIVTAGFCWGGTQTFRYATNNSKLKGAFVFYGSPPLTGQSQVLPVDTLALGRISAPVYGFYAGNDARINATLPATVEAMKDLKKQYEPVTYEGAGHGFMRAGDAPEPVAPTAKGDAEADKAAADKYAKDLVAYKANKKARDEAWVRWKAILAKI
ncbi:MAG TPA: dienelactone hydrolase family protein [Pyrinomonadaceae bacterium]|nr:dienelactone hydrolase family protein [Pyrinomonadaceae bacterium]